VNRWVDAEHARAYLADRAAIPYQSQAMTVLAEFVPPEVERVLDLGTGDGITMALVRELRPRSFGVSVDFSDAMLAEARARFAEDRFVEVVEHDLDLPLPTTWGMFDLVVSSFAIHHLPDSRKQRLYGEIFGLLRPRGVFLNLEHVASPTPELHLEFLAALGRGPGDDDPSNILAPVEEQLGWLREIGFTQVDCHWKWRELALLAGLR
jgi:SAM-dependent methyltransferase